MPNTSNINRVIAAISAAGNNPNHPNLGFNMEFHLLRHTPPGYDRSDFQCTSVACICGWTNLVSGHHTASDDDHAAEFLGIDIDTAMMLFYPDWATDRGAGILPYEATPAQAVRLLEILRDTGELRWTEALQKVAEPA